MDQLALHGKPQREADSQAGQHQKGAARRGASQEERAVPLRVEPVVEDEQPLRCLRLIQIMIKNRYVLSQEQCCQAQGNFAIHQRHEERQEQHESGFSEFNFAPQDNVGRFQQKESVLFCCSCKNIKRLSLQLYGQQLSLAESYGNGCCLGNACSGDLVVYSHSKVILGTISKTCSAWCSQNVLLIQDENRKEIFSLRMQCCQWANFCPRFLRCSRAVQYQVVDCRGERAAVVRNVSRSWCAMQDDFQLQFVGVEKEKEKILLLNAVVYLNLMRHECL